MSGRMGKQLFFLVVVVCMLCIACRGREEIDDEAIKEENKPEKLVVYINGSPNTIESQYVSDEFYPTNYTIGPRHINGIPEASGGNVFQTILEEYEEKTGINIEIYYLDDPGVDERYALQELYETGQDMPDLVIANKYHQYDYYNMAKQGLLLDVSPYISNDDEKQDDELYFKRILDDGKIYGKQYIIPLTFNINALITSDSYLNEIGFQISESQVDYEEIIYLLKHSCMEMVNSKGKEAIYESSGTFNGQYIMGIMLSAAYDDYFDDEVNSTFISEEVLTSIFQVMELYIQQEYTNLYGYENLTYDQLRNSGESKKMYINTMLSGQDESIGIFLTGGRGGGSNISHNVILDAVYFNSKFKERNEEMIFVPIPTYDESDAYSANVETFMFSFSDCAYPEAIYDLMSYLMEYDLGIEMGLSISREITEKQLNEAQNTFLTIAPNESSWANMMLGLVSREEILESMEELKPLDSNYIDSIRSALNNLSGAGLPYYPLEGLIFRRALEDIGEGQRSPSEAAVWSISKIEERLNLMESNIAFYDETYEFSLLGID